jgi:hypothetical protein
MRPAREPYNSETGFIPCRRSVTLPTDEENVRIERLESGVCFWGRSRACTTASTLATEKPPATPTEFE